MIQAIDAHPDISAGTFTMNVLSSGTDDITSDSGQTIGSSATQSVSSPSYTNQTVIYVSGSSYSSDVCYLTYSQTYTYSKNINTQITPDLICSSSGSTTISFSIASYSGNTIPSWVVIDSSSGVLTVTTPDISSSTDYSFYISGTISGVSSVINKLITIKVQVACFTSNCQICSAMDSTL